MGSARWIPWSGADSGEDSPAPSHAQALPLVPLFSVEVRQMGRKNPTELVLAAVGLVVLLCASTVVGIELGRFLGAIWR